MLATAWTFAKRLAVWTGDKQAFSYGHGHGHAENEYGHGESTREPQIYMLSMAQQLILLQATIMRIQFPLYAFAARNLLKSGWAGNWSPYE